MRIIEDHSLGYIRESGHNRYGMVLSEEWLKILAYCTDHNIAPEDVFIDLNFGLLDEQ
jgi:hypothetical protein